MRVKDRFAAIRDFEHVLTLAPAALRSQVNLANKPENASGGEQVRAAKAAALTLEPSHLRECLLIALGER